MTTTVFFVRHGTHNRLGHILCGRMGGVALSPEGLAQAMVAADRLAGEGLAAVYSSPMERTRQTAEPIAEAAGVPVEEAEALIEIDIGDWTGKSFDELRDDPEWVRWNRERGSARAPGGESMAEVQQRLRAWLEEIIAQHPDEKVCAVSHADVIKAALMQALGLPLDQHDRFEVSPGSVSVLAAGDWGMKVFCINEAPR